MLLRSELLSAHGFVHGFSTRNGGVSEGPFASLNLGHGVGDEPERIEKNLGRFASAIGIAQSALYTVSQVHGAEVRSVGPRDDPREVSGDEADAVLASTPGIAVGVRTADCIPVLIGDCGSGRVVAVHAGWRGIVRGVVRRAVERLAPEGSPVAAVGPGASTCCFEVGPDVADQIAGASSPDVVGRGSAGRLTVDLHASVQAQLARAGVFNVERVPGCTICDPARFFSFRREGRRSGRMLSVICARGRI